MMILTTRAVRTEYLVAELSTTTTNIDCGGKGGSVGGGGGGDGGDGGGDGIRYHALGGPFLDDVPSKRAYDAIHADAS